MLVPNERYYSPNHNGPRSNTRLIILHSTRGNANSLENEYRGTINYLINPQVGLSVHAVIAFNGEWSQLLDWNLIGYHAGEHNLYSIGIELVQRKRYDEISDAQYKTLKLIIRELRSIYGLIPMQEHKDTVQGIRTGKSDIGLPFRIERIFDTMPRTPDQQNIINILNGWSGGNTDSNFNLLDIANWIDCGALHQQADSIRAAANEIKLSKEALEGLWPN